MKFGRRRRELESLRQQVAAYEAILPYAEIAQEVGKRALTFLASGKEGEIAGAIGRAITEYETAARRAAVEGAFNGLSAPERWDIVQHHFPVTDIQPLLKREQERAARMANPTLQAQHAKEVGFLPLDEVLPGRSLTLKFSENGEHELITKKADNNRQMNVLDFRHHYYGLDEVRHYSAPLADASNLVGTVAAIGSISVDERGNRYLVPALYEASFLGTPSDEYSDEKFDELPRLAGLELEGLTVF